MPVLMLGLQGTLDPSKVEESSPGPLLGKPNPLCGPQMVDIIVLVPQWGGKRRDQRR